MFKMTKILLVSALTLICFTSNAAAAPQVEVSITAEKEVTVKENGKKVTKRVKAEEILPGDVVFYTLSFTNNGDEAATEVALVDPIPENTAYIAGSAFGEGADIAFSIDQGRSYQKPTLLTYTVNGKKQIASAEEYTHIRWLVKSIAPAKSGMVGFQVVVK